MISCLFDGVEYFVDDELGMTPEEAELQLLVTAGRLSPVQIVPPLPEVADVEPHIPSPQEIAYWNRIHGVGTGRSTFGGWFDV